MTRFGTPLTDGATRVLLLGAGELGKEVAIELQRLGVEVIACDRYADAPAMQVAHRSHVLPMLDGARLREVIEQEKPQLIVPEIEAIHTPTLLELEAEGYTVVPTARAARLTMDREGIRRLAAETLGLPTSPYRFADDADSFRAAVAEVGLPCVVKPVMSSSGKGQSTVKRPEEIDAAWDYAQHGGRSGAGRVIVEGFVDFDYEITQLTVRALDANGQITTHFCEPIGHRQVSGDYVESWQPHEMSAFALGAATSIAARIATAMGDGNLGGRGIFGVELFVKGDDVYFSEVSPRPHDTGLVTMATQRLSEFEMHARAILGLDIGRVGDAQHRVVRFAEARFLEARRIGGDERQVTRVGEIDQRLLRCFFDRVTAADKLDVEPVGEQRLQAIGIGRGARGLILGEQTRERSLAARGQREETRGMPFQRLECDVRRMFERSVEMRLADQGAQIVVTGRILRVERDPVDHRCAALRHVGAADAQHRADHRLHTSGKGTVGKSHRSVQAVAIGQSGGGKAELCRTLGDRLRIDRAVEHGVAGKDAERHEPGMRHRCNLGVRERFDQRRTG